MIIDNRLVVCYYLFMKKYIERILDVSDLLKNKSYFLFGPRQTGKTQLLRHTLKKAKFYDLLESDTYLNLSSNPSKIRYEITEEDKLVVIDEIQRIPSLLNEVHLLIEKYDIKFLLTGSSARKLRRRGVNLLGGRARSISLHPFVYAELKNFDLLYALNYGLLPSIYLSDNPQEDIKSYAGNYLREEIASEGLTRNIPAFSRFLEVAALCSGTMINFSKIANDTQVAKSTVREYFQILQDTLIASILPAWTKTKKRKPISTAKFYFFDTGIVRYLRQQGEIKEKSPEFGEFFETYMHHEIKSYISYKNSNADLSYWRSKTGFEVDFIYDNRIAIEIKAKQNINHKDMKGIKALKEEHLLERYIIVTTEKQKLYIDDIDLLPWRDFLDILWTGGFDK